MPEHGILTFDDPDGYAAAFGDTRINLTIAGAGDFKARLIRLRLKQLEICCCSETLPRIAYISLPPERMFLSFPVGTVSLTSDGVGLGHGDCVLHGLGQAVHQRTSSACQWGLVALSAAELSNCAGAMAGRDMPLPRASRVLCLARPDALRLQCLFGHACHLAESGEKLTEQPELARVLEQEMLHAVIHCLEADEQDDNQKVRHHHAAIMIRFEDALSERLDDRLKLPALCAEIGVPERTLRLCCAEFLGVSPTRYLLLRRLNKARSALRLADPSTVTVAEIARNHQFLELGRFAVTYRTTFGESPSATLHRDPQP